MRIIIKSIFVLTIYLTSFNCFCQAPKLDTLFEDEETTIIFQSNEFFTVTNSKNELITGWVRSHNEDIYFLRHYAKGKLDGYSVFYIKKKKEFRLQEISRYEDGKIKTRALFSHRKQLSGSTGFSYGLKSYKIWNPDSTYSNLIYLAVKNENKIIAHCYNPESNKKNRYRYSSELFNKLKAFHKWELGQKYFPFVLNKNKDIFSFIKYDGYYFFNQRFDTKTDKGYTYFIKFYPNSTVHIIKKNKVLTSINDWEESSKSIYKVDFDNRLNFADNSFLIQDNGKVIAKGIFIITGLILEVKNYENGPFKRYYLKFVTK